jgi:cell division protease FtsH
MQMGRQQNVSEATAQKIDSEVRRLVEDGLNDARRILTEKAHELEALARGLLEYETLSGDEIRHLLDGQPPVRDDGGTSGAKHRTSRPAVPPIGSTSTPKLA